MKKRIPKFPTDKVMPRYITLVSLFAIVGVVILCKAGHIMFFEHDYWLTVSEKYESRNRVLPATRGNILSADGQVLATSLPEYRIYLDPMSWETDSIRRTKDQHRRDSILTHSLDSITEGMKRILPNLDVAALKRSIHDGRQRGSHNISLYPRRVTYIQLTELKQLPLFRLPTGLGGFYTEEFRRRKNPYGHLAARTIGKLRAENDSAVSGLELAFDKELSGKPGWYHRQKVSNRYIKMIDTLAIDGDDVVTTIDVSMQDIAEKALSDQLQALKARAGMCILMEVATGDVKAISSLSRLEDGTYAEIEPRAVTNMMEPGSVFKPLSFMVAMDDGKITMNTTCDTGSGIKDIHGRKMRDADWRKGGNGVLTVPEIIKKSSNVGVSTLIDHAYGTDPDKFVEGLQRIGIMEDLHIPIPGYRVPRIRYRRDNPARWYGTTLPWMSIGYETQIPPISTLTFYNGVANGGKLVQPRFVTEIRHNGEPVKEFPVVVLREQMCKESTLLNIRKCLEGVVGKNSGTGKLAYSKFFRVAGKTGTAQIWSKHGFSADYLVSFAGYFPADAPQYSMIVCIEKTAPAYGGMHCCPVFKKIAETVMARNLNSNYINATDSTRWRTAVPDMAKGNLNALQAVLEQLHLPHHSRNVPRGGIAWGGNIGGYESILLSKEQKVTGMPSVIGYGLRDAVYRLERIGLTVKATGIGRVVRQSIPPGSRLRRKMKVVLLLSTDEKHILPEEEADFKHKMPVNTDSTPTSEINEIEISPTVAAVPSNKEKAPALKSGTSTTPQEKKQLSSKSATKKPISSDANTDQEKTLKETKKNTSLIDKSLRKSSSHPNPKSPSDKGKKSDLLYDTSGKGRKSGSALGNKQKT